jgi:transcriptional regulator with PAS, ATPase and Fis domain
VTWKTTVQRGPERRAAQPTPVVRILSTPGSSWRSVRLPITGNTVVVGRAVGAEGVAFPNDDRVSRRHATLSFSRESRQVQVQDESSTGTFVQGRRIREGVANEGDLIRVGDSFFLVRFELDADGDVKSSLVGESPALRAVRRTLALVGRSDAAVLILGESGTGKELAARAVHAESGRSGPFVAVNCGAIPEALAESQLFGHVAGSFTGARSDAPGFFRSASGGTLFLDEIGELPLILQPKLLRAVEERAVIPVGATRDVSCDVRIVSATNRDLTNRDSFRADLFARLSDFVVEIPPLRARREDILPILSSLLGSSEAVLDPELVQSLLLYDYPHNARDVRRIGKQLELWGAGRSVWDASLIDALDHFVSSPPPGELADAAERGDDVRSPSGDELAVPTREELIVLLRTHRGVIADVARETGRSRKQVYRWLERYGLSLDDYRSG